MRVSDLMSRTVISAPGTTPVLEARALMQKERIRHLLVVDDGRLQGIVTDRDIRLNMASPATSLSVWELNHLLARLTVGTVMTRHVIAVDPERDAREAARIMIDHTIGALPVLEGEHLLGIITETDLLRAFVESSERATEPHPSWTRPPTAQAGLAAPATTTRPPTAQAGLAAPATT